MNIQRILELPLKKEKREFPGGLAVKNLMSSLLWLGVSPWPRSFCMPRAWPERKKGEGGGREGGGGGRERKREEGRKIEKERERRKEGKKRKGKKEKKRKERKETQESHPHGKVLSTLEYSNLKFLNVI